MSVEQAIHELQEQLQRVSARHQAMHQEIDYTPQYCRYEVVHPVGGTKDLDARPVRKDQWPELESLVVFGERFRRCFVRRAQAGDEGCRESEATDRCSTFCCTNFNMTNEKDQELKHLVITRTEGAVLEFVRGVEREPGLEHWRRLAAVFDHLPARMWQFCQTDDFAHTIQAWEISEQRHRERSA